MEQIYARVLSAASKLSHTSDHDVRIIEANKKSNKDEITHPKSAATIKESTKKKFEEKLLTMIQKMKNYKKNVL